MPIAHLIAGSGVRGRAPRLHVVVIGAGFGGLAAAKKLARADIAVTLIDKQNHHLFQPLLYQVATAGLSPADIAAPVRTIVKDHPHTRVLLDEVEGVDVQAKRVRLTSGAQVGYDALVIATGARHSYYGRDEWAEHAHGIKTIDDALRVRRNVLLCMERAETRRAENMAERDEHLTFLVVGGGPTGVEMAGAVAELTRHAAEMEFRQITKKCLRIILIEAGPRLLPTFPEALGAAAEKALGRLGVQVRLGGRVTRIDAQGAEVDGRRIPAVAVIWAAGVQASPAAAWLDAEADRAGRVVVDAGLRVPGAPDVYVIGDTAAVVDATGRPVPGVAPAAKQQGAYVARAIAAHVSGRRGPGPFRYKDHGNLATIGRKRAVADLGWLKLSGASAWLLWCTAHIYFLVGFRNRLVVGANWLWNYLTFERGARLITGVDGAYAGGGLGAPAAVAARVADLAPVAERV